MLLVVLVSVCGFLVLSVSFGIAVVVNSVEFAISLSIVGLVC